MNFAAADLFCSIVSDCTEGQFTNMPLPSVWIEMIQGHLQQLKVIQPDIVHVLPTETSNIADPLAFLLPPVLFWSPMEAYGYSMTCSKCVPIRQVTLEPHSWTLETKGSQIHHTRVIHGIDSPTLLVSRIYKCSHGHLFAAHYEEILRQLPHDIFVPFKLSHRSGFTHTLQDFTFRQVQGTMSLRKIAAFLNENHLSFFLQRCKLFHSANYGEEYKPCPTFEEWYQLIGVCNLHTNHSVIAASFIQKFTEMERVYDIHMQRITIDEDKPYLTCDHTFRSAGWYHAISIVGKLNPRFNSGLLYQCFSLHKYHPNYWTFTWHAHARISNITVIIM